VDHGLLLPTIGMLRRSVLLALVVGLAGCLSTPSIPIPPPTPEEMTFTITTEPTKPNTATFSYPADPAFAGSVVYVYNRTQGVGVIQNARDDGSVGPTAPFPAEIGNQVSVSFQREDQTVSACVVLRQGAQSSTDYCD
jgi:hypothetical protein